MVIILDIETIPDQRPGAWERCRERLEPPANYKKPEAIDKWLAEHADEAYQKTALDGAYGELACICLQREGEDTYTIPRTDAGEVEILKHLDQWFKNEAMAVNDVFAGHCVEFDLRFLWQRACLLGFPSLARRFVRYRNCRPWHGNVIDTAYEWTGKEYGIKLKPLCEAFGIDGDDIDGADVWQAYQAGEMDRIMHHCQMDVHRVSRLLDAMGLW